MNFILAIDQGTTTTTALIMDQEGRTVAVSSCDYPAHYPALGFVEHLDHEIKNSVKLACQKALTEAKIKATDIAGIGITNQRETVCLFNQESQAVRPFVVWQCRRSADICLELRSKNLADFFLARTGLPLDPYFSASKLLWLFRHEPHLEKLAADKKILFGTIDTFLCHWLSGGRLHITDPTNASRTMLMDIARCDWDQDCLKQFSIPASCLPQIKKSVGPYGSTKGLDFLPDGIPLAAIAGDQQAALFGQSCFKPGEAKATYGTGCFILLNTGHEPVHSRHGLVTSVAYQLSDKATYCLEGSAFIAGAAVQFLRDTFGLIDEAHQIEELAKSVPDDGGVLFVPALCGLGAPYWRPKARGIFTGLELGSSKGHIARAVLQGIALQNVDILSAMAKDGQSPRSLKVDGGAANNDLLMQIQADLLGLPCLRPASAQKTALGAARLAGLALGFFKDLAEIKALEEPAREFLPAADGAWAQSLIERYHQALNKT